MHNLRHFLIPSFCLIVFSFISIIGLAQTGPGGVGNSSNNILWLRASDLGLSNGDPISQWSDSSGNNNHATQATGSNQPTFRTNQVNGLPSIDFDGVDDVLSLSSNITTQDMTVFIIYYRSSSTVFTYTGHFMTEKHGFQSSPNAARMIYANRKLRYPIVKTDDEFSIFSLQTIDDAVDSIYLRDGTNFASHGIGAYLSNNSSVIGARINPNNQAIDKHSLGSIAEIIVYDEKINDAKRKIVGNYLATKYDLIPEVDLYAYDASHPGDLIGIGEESNGDHTNSQARGSISISSPGSLEDGEYLFTGHDNAGFGTSSSVPPALVERWDQVWRVDQTGDVGSVNIEIFLGSNGFASPLNYALIIETDNGDFSDGNTTVITGGSFNAGNNSMTFNGVTLPDNSYFTLAEVSGTIEAIANDDWDKTTTWSCGCIPGSADIASIPSPFTVSIDRNDSINFLDIAAGGGLSFSSTDTLFVLGDLTIDGSITANSGTISAVRTTDSQTFTNSSGVSVDFNNLHVSNASGLILDDGGWTVTNNLQVVSGGMDVSSVDSIVLVSNASKTMQILPSMIGAFTGDFIVQRFISTRAANYANLSSPVEGATIADLDDDLFLSGVGGPDGNALVSGGGIFYSVYSYYSRNGQNGSLQSTTEPLNVGQGYEVFLADNLSTFNGKVIDFVGTPNVGKPSPNLLSAKGWNLWGNPLQAHIAYDSINKDIFLPEDYYIFNSSTGSYDFFTGTGKPTIAPGQGFWFNTNAGGKLLEIDESDKISTTSSAFLRVKKTDPFFNLTLNSLENNFSHKLRIDFSSYSIEEKDLRDAIHLPSPFEQAPAITSKATNSNEELILNSLNPMEESHIIPVSIHAGVSGEYQISSNNIEKVYENYSCIYLKDKLNNNQIDLSVEPIYSFESSAGESDRFEIILSNNYEQCQKMLDSDVGFIQNFESGIDLRNVYDNWFLDYTFDERVRNVSIHIYNMSGQEVRSPFIFSASNSGSFQLSNLENLTGIYLVQVKSEGQILNKKIKF